MLSLFLFLPMNLQIVATNIFLKILRKLLQIQTTAMTVYGAGRGKFKKSNYKNVFIIIKTVQAFDSFMIARVSHKDFNGMPTWGLCDGACVVEMDE